MTAGDQGMGPEAGELRRQLLLAQDDAGAREVAVETLLECRVLAVTWPNTPDAVRTLTNGEGEQAMPLFTGREELQRAAARFGWINPDGSLSTRTLAVRDALAGALMQGVDFVVVDVSEEHGLELSRDEVENALRPGGPKPKHPAVQRRLRPSEPTAPIQLTPLSAPSVPIPPRFASRRPAQSFDIDTPFDQVRTGRSSLVAIEEVVRSRLRRDPRVDPSGPVSRRPAGDTRARERETEPETVPLRPSAKRRSSLGPSAPLSRERNGAPHVRSIAPARSQTAGPEASSGRSVAPARGAAQSPEATRARSVPPPRPPSVAPRAPIEALPEPSPQRAFRSVLPPSLPEVCALDVPPRPAAAPTLPDMAAVMPSPNAAPLPSLPLDLSGDLGTPEANPAALEAAAMVAQVGKLAGDAATQQAAAEVAAMLKDMAQNGKVEETQAAAQGMVKTLADMFASELHREGKRAQPQEAESPAKPDTQEAAPAPAAAVPAAAPNAPFEDALLDAVADALRKFPEVEWACQIADEAGAPSIAMRIEPSFMTRMDEIKAAVAKAGQAHGKRVGCTTLTDPQRMRDARAHGLVFFPWRKRGKKSP